MEDIERDSGRDMTPKLIGEESWQFYQEDNPLDFLLIKSVWQEGYSDFNILEIEEI